MFESDIRNRADTQRSEIFGHNRGFSSDRGTVYSELKLSDKLGKVIASLEESIVSMNQQVKDSSQDKEGLLKANQLLHFDLINSETMIKHLTQENVQLQRELAGIKFSISTVSNQMIKYKSLYEDLLEENAKISKNLQDEKAINDIR